MDLGHVSIVETRRNQPPGPAGEHLDFLRKPEHRDRDALPGNTTLPDPRDIRVQRGTNTVGDRPNIRGPPVAACTQLCARLSVVPKYIRERKLAQN